MCYFQPHITYVAFTFIFWNLKFQICRKIAK